MAGRSQELPAKENALFKSIVKLYTTKQYKKGLKAADQVLAKFPNHGETLAMKGLILNCMDKKTEAYDYVRRGLKNNLTSHVCWHTYGLLYRSDRNYLEAIKCYRNALKHEKDNMQILRDLSLLQIQMRDLTGYSETRRQILTLKPSQRNGWVAFSMAAHLLGAYEKALGILESYENTLPEDAKTGFEYGETLLYKNMMLEESGQLERALAHLDSSEKYLVDKQSAQEQRAALLHRLARYEEAERVLRGLIKINPDNLHYHHGLVAARLHVDPKTALESLRSAKPDDAGVQSLAALYEELARDYPKCLAVRRIPLEFLRGDAFRSALETYIRADLRRGVPSLFIGLKSLYSDPEKRKTLDEVFRSTYESLNKKHTFPNEEKKETPSTELWACYLLAHHLDRVGDFEAALDYIGRAVAHTPTVIELYVLQAKILKHAGDVQGAWAAYEKAREMDLADRYLNTKATLYALRADKVDTAERTIALFTSKEGADSQETLFEMQCMWYETECGKSYLRTGQYGKALKKLLAVDKHFADIVEDQFDFHTYCLRKMTLRTYVKMLRLEDDLYAHKFFQRAAQAAVQTYLAVFDKPPASEKDEKEDQYAGLSEKERKIKMKRDKEKQEKAKARAEKEKEEQEKAEKGANPAQPKKAAKPADPDPEGNTLISGDVLGEATKLIRTLQKYAPKDFTTNILAFKVYLRRKKYLLAIQSLKRAAAQNPTHPDVTASALLLAHASTQLPPDTPEIVQKVLSSSLPALLQNTPPAERVAQLVAAPDASLAHLTAAARLTPSVHPQATQDAVKRILTFPLAPAHGHDARATLRDAIEAREALRAVATPEEVEKFTQACHAQFKLAAAFAPPAPPQPAAESTSPTAAS